jgi:hypothetical protein
MNRIIKLFLVAGCILPHFILAQSSDFSGFHAPFYPGERKATVVVELKGVNPDKVDLILYYSTNKVDVERNLASHAVARKQEMENSRIKGEFIFPHRDHPRPNDDTDVNPRIYNADDPVIYYKWVKRIKSGSGMQYVDDVVRQFEMPRLLIIAYAGDSYAAGEGAPEDENDKWIDDDCHRSERSGGMRAIKKLIAQHPEYGIRYINVTCSGAEISDFTSADIRSAPLVGSAAWSRPAQLFKIQEWMKERKRKVVDLFLMGIGGNDVGFGPIGTSTLLAGTSNLPEVKSLAEDGFASISGAYDNLDIAIRAGYEFEVGRIIIFNYPDPTRQSDGEFCHPDVGGLNPLDCWGLVEKRIRKEDFEFLYTDFVVKLNDAVKSAAERNGWDLVNIQNNSRKHGLCNCADPYFNTLGQSFAMQGDIYGTIHPNATGYKKIYRDEVYAQLLSSIRKEQEDLRNAAIAAAKAKSRERMKQNAAAAKRALLTLNQTKRRIPIRPFTAGVKPIKPKLEEEDKGKLKDAELGKE